MQYSQALRLDQELFERCLEQDQVLEKVRADQAEGRRLGVTGTPTFFIGIVRADGGIDLMTRIRGIASVDVFAEESEAAGSSLRSGRRRVRHPQPVRQVETYEENYNEIHDCDRVLARDVQRASTRRGEPGNVLLGPV